MRIALEERFLRACLAANSADRMLIFEALLDVEQVLRNPHAHSGLGVRKLHPSGIWEVRVSRALRALFALREGTATFLFLGTHDEVNRFLREL